MDQGHDVTIAAKSTGNIRFFRNKLLIAGINSKVVNTIMIKVINELVKEDEAVALLEII